MDEIQIEKELMDMWVRIASSVKTNEEYIESAKKFDALSDWYKSIVETYQKKVEHYRELQQIAKNAANMNRDLSQKVN